MQIKALGYVIIDTPIAGEWDSFLTGVVGTMKGKGAPNGERYRIDGRPFRLWVRDGESEALTAAYEVGSPGDLESLRGIAKDKGCSVEDGAAEEASARCVDAFVRVIDPSGNRLEFFHGDTRDDVAFESPVGVSEFVTGDMGMGHAVFGAPPPHFDATHDFYKAVGFRDTDIPHFKFSPDPDDPGMRFAFMHASNGRHHSVAIGEMPSPPAGCVHLMLEMKTMSDVGLCHDRMRKAKVPESATLGRHVNDQTFGFYMQTPGGYDIEIGCDPLVIDPKEWKPTAHLQPSEWGHVWSWQKETNEEGEGA